MGLRAPARQRATGRILQVGQPPNVRATQSEADRDSLVDNTSNSFSTIHRQSVAHDRTMMMPGDVGGEAARRNSPKFSGLIALEENAEDRIVAGIRERDTEQSASLHYYSEHFPGPPLEHFAFL
jgi:hypothetical protein